MELDQGCYPRGEESEAKTWADGIEGKLWELRFWYLGK